MNWFEELTGFREITPDQVRQNIHLEGENLISHVNGKVMNYGILEIPTLAELRERVYTCYHDRGSGEILAREVVADVQKLHLDKHNAGSMFQVASQFNLLEMVSPDVIPEQGVGIYENDHTQGPACAIAAGAGTIYRNYFVPLRGKLGQSKKNQIDCLEDIGQELGNSDGHLWQMRNGYALVSQSGLIEISNRIRNSNEFELDSLRKLLRIGIQWNTQVTLNDSKHLVSQAYCSSLPVAYSSHFSELWEDFARLVLEAAYEATICAAILNNQSSRNKSVFLTLLGGGAFGNKRAWITDSIERVMQRYRDWGLDVVIVSYGASQVSIRQIVEKFQ